MDLTLIRESRMSVFLYGSVEPCGDESEPCRDGRTLRRRENLAEMGVNLAETRVNLAETDENLAQKGKPLATQKIPMPPTGTGTNLNKSTPSINPELFTSFQRSL